MHGSINNEHERLTTLRAKFIELLANPLSCNETGFPVQTFSVLIKIKPVHRKGKFLLSAEGLL